MYKLSLSLKSKIESLVDFDNSQKDAINSSINQLIINKKLDWAFFILEKNFKILFAETDLIFNNLAKNVDLNTWEELESAALEINRNFLNYLASQSAYLDHSLKYLSNHFGEDSEEFTNFKTITGDFFDNNFSYRFLYNLRNYSVHFGYSVCGITIERNKKTVSYIPVFLLSELLLYKKWHRLVKADLNNLNDNFKAFNLIKASFECFVKLHEYLNKILSSSNIENKETILNILNLKDNIDDYCFLLDNGKEVKITQIPTHYLK